MADVGNIVISLNAKTEQFNRAMTAASKKTEALAGTLKSFGRGMSMYVTLPLAAAATASVHFANKMNAAMANVGSLGVDIGDLQGLKREMQDTAISVGGSTEDMAKGLYQVVSAFGHTAESGKLLAINAKAAKAGLTDVSTAVALTSAVTKGYGDTSAEAVQKVSDLAFKTVELGQTDFPQLATSIMRVTSLSENFGISQEELFASFAALTGVTGEAARVSTQFQGALQALMAPSESLTDLLTKQGFVSAKAAIASLGWQETLVMIANAAEASGEPLQKYIGSIEGQLFATALAGKQAEDYTSKLGAMSESMGAAERALAAQTTGMNAVGFMMDQVGTKLSVLAERIGDRLIPVVGKLIDMGMPVIDWLIDMVDGFGRLNKPVQIIIGSLIGLVGVVGPIIATIGALIPVLTNVGAAFKFVYPLIKPLVVAIMAISSPTWIVIAAIAAIGVALTYFADDIIGWVAKIIDSFVDKTLNRFVDGFNGMREGIATALNWLVDKSNWMRQKLNETFGTSLEMLTHFTEESIPELERFATTGETAGKRFSDSMHNMKNAVGEFVDSLLYTKEPMEGFREEAAKTGSLLDYELVPPILKIPDTMKKIPPSVDLVENSFQKLGRESFGKMKGLVKDMNFSFGSFRSTVKGLAGELGGFFKDLLKMAAKKGIMKIIDSLTGGTGAGGAAAGFGLGVLGKIGGMFGFAKGGIVKEPTAMIGLRTGGRGIMAEAGPEAIVPLGLGGGGGRGPIALTVNVYGSVGVEDIGDQLVKTLRTKGIA